LEKATKIEAGIRFTDSCLDKIKSYGRLQTALYYWNFLRNTISFVKRQINTSSSNEVKVLEDHLTTLSTTLNKIRIDHFLSLLDVEFEYTDLSKNVSKTRMRDIVAGAFGRLKVSVLSYYDVNGEFVPRQMYEGRDLEERTRLVKENSSLEQTGEIFSTRLFPLWLINLINKDKSKTVI